MGGGKQPPPDGGGVQNPFLPPGVGAGAPGGDDSGKNDQGQSSGSSANSKMEAYRFDSAALERAAKAAKDLERSSKYCALSFQKVALVYVLFEADLEFDSSPK